jgi:hypothetical protein
MRPFCRLPVATVIPPPTIIAAIGAPTPVAISAAPATIGRILDRNPASGSPVSGLMVKDPPCAIAKPWRLLTSPGDI